MDEEIEVKSEVCDLCRKDLVGDELKKWEKESAFGLLPYSCNACDKLSHFEKALLKQIHGLSQAIMLMALQNQPTDEADDEEEKKSAAQNDKTLAAYLDK